jgi:exosortase
VVALLAVWVALFHWLGNSTLGYTNTKSLFGWWYWTMTVQATNPQGEVEFSRVLNGDEFHAWIIPLVVLGLIWVRRSAILALPKRVCWPALALVLVALAFHFLGYLVQQTRISVLAFFLGIYGLTGLFWGAGWLRSVTFPFLLFIFCVPLGAAAEPLTVPLRLVATRCTSLFCDGVLGIGVIQEGNRLFDPAHTYSYEVAMVCSGIKSLTTILAFGVIYAYLGFQSWWRRCLIVATAIPMAVAANVCRLSLIIIAAETFSPEAGNYVHDSGFLSLVPYIPAFGGMLLLGWWLREDRRPRAARTPAEGPVLMPNAETEPKQP